MSAAEKVEVSHQPVADLKMDGGTQPRSRINDEVVSEYAALWKSGAEFPPVIAFHDGATTWLADGFHRTHAARQAGVKSIPAEVYPGTRRDAILYSVGANAAHGVRRTNEDKRKAVMTLLQDEEWGQWSDREIARQCAVSKSFVNSLRSSLSTNASEPAPPRTYKNKHGTVSTMRTDKIGRKKPAEVTDSNGTVKKPVEERREEISTLAAEGHRAEQIASKLGVDVARVRRIAKRFDIPLPDQHIGKVHHVQVRRVIEQTITGLEGYALGLNTIGSLSEVTSEEASEWLESLTASLKALNKLKRNLTEIANG